MSTRAQTITRSGDATGAPTFQRPVEDLSTLSMIGTAAHCALYSFSVAVSGLQTFTTTGDFDTFALLYETPFVPAAALSHALIATDDLAAMRFNFSGFQFALVAGQSYSYGPRRRAPVPVRKIAYDFDGDGKADITV